MKILITGGAGFIGTNMASHFAQKAKNSVVIFDNLSRTGTKTNKDFLLKKHKNIRFIRGDIRKSQDIDRVLARNRFDLILHFAGQVAVTSSVKNPQEDFDINAKGTLNLLEAMRTHQSKAVLLYSSTNKVYGKMESLVVIEKNKRYGYRDYPHGISESQPLDFHSPYGCSKGAADQYIRDYHRIYGIKTIVFRQSCIYGWNQFGIEDQGWVAWFTIAASFNLPVTIYGDGKQVRDVLFIDDLGDAIELAVKNIKKTNGKIYNIGGGSYQMSLLELVRYLEKHLGRRLKISYGPWRPGDQKVFVSDIRKARKDFGWRPRISAAEGVAKLYDWVNTNKTLIKKTGLF